MRLNLNPIVGRPGSQLPFQFIPQLPDPPSCTLRGPAEARGHVANVAGALELVGEVKVPLTCRCDRCAVPFQLEKRLPITAYLAEELTDEDNPDIFLLDKGTVDLDEVFLTGFLLAMESKIICDDGCLGLCITCGANLNEGPCTCPGEVDPRLAALQQLLE